MIDDPYKLVGQWLRAWLDQEDAAIELLKQRGYRISGPDYTIEGCATGETNEQSTLQS